MKFIIYNPETKLFDFFINSLKKEFNTRNIDILLINNKKINEYYEYINFENDIILIMINPHFVSTDKIISNEIINISIIFKYKILYLSEPINYIVEKKVYSELINKLKPYSLWTYTNDNLNKLDFNPFLKKLISNTYKIFPNYNDFYNFSDLKNIEKKNINNIIFFGNINDNRIETCNTFKDKLINMKDVWTKEVWSEILNNNLFYLNIHRRNNCKSFEAFRIIPILANGGFVFSERCNEIDENIYKDYNIIFVEKEDLYNIFIEYIKNISFEEIKIKTLLFRRNMEDNIELDKYINFHEKIAKSNN